jgi:hypothetical protein
MAGAVEKVRDRLRRAARALEEGEIPYALVGGNAVAVWVSEVDESAVRNSQDVEFLLRRVDLDRAKEALGAAGFIFRHSSGIEMFLDGPEARERDAVHILFAGKKVRPEYALPAPDVDESQMTTTCRVLSLDGLLRMKLTSYRLKDRVHVQDLIEIGLIDASWVSRLPGELGNRLQEMLDNPEG